MAPIKALCSEKYTSWKEKFEPHNLKCAELTGDTEVDDYYELQEVNIILTTPVSTGKINKLTAFYSIISFSPLVQYLKTCSRS